MKIDTYNQLDEIIGFPCGLILLTHLVCRDMTFKDKSKNIVYVIRKILEKKYTLRLIK
jgi:hypothetical protein